MKLPRVKQKRRETIFEQEFKGLNQNLRIDSGEFNFMRNITLDHYPVIGTRQGFRERYSYSGNANGLHEYKENTLMAVFGQTLYTDITDECQGHAVSGSSDLLEDSEKSFATIGTKTVIMPDKVIYDDKTKKLEKIEKNVRWDYPATSGAFYRLCRLIPCDIEGTTAWEKGHRVYETADEDHAPAVPVDGDWWFNIDEQIWYEYSAENSRWQKIELGYSKLIPVLTSTASLYTREENPTEEDVDNLDAVRAFFQEFAPLDSINIKMANMDNWSYLEEDEYVDYPIYALVENLAIGYDAWHNPKYKMDLVIGVQAFTNMVCYDIRRVCPDLEHIVASNNRIWGANQKEHELFACKLGDPTQWYNYIGLASDSYAVSLGFDAEITAGCEYNNYVHFFTEDKIIKIYGDYPSNYQFRGVPADGVVSGAHETLVQVEGLLFWVSPVGVVSYDGSQPYIRSHNLKPNYLSGKKVVSGRDGTKYVMSVDGGNEFGVYAYDVSLGMWSTFGLLPFKKAAQLKNALCFINSGGKLVTLCDRYLTEDIALDSENVFVTTGRTGVDDFTWSDSNYMKRFFVDHFGDFTAASASDVTTTVFNGNVNIETKRDYWTGHGFKNAGCVFPVIFENEEGPAKKYELYYETNDPENSVVTVTVIDEESSEVIENYENVKTGDIIDIPVGWIVAFVTFGCHHVHDYEEEECYFSNIRMKEAEKEDIMWDLETGDLGLDTPNQKYISRIQLRMDLRGSLQIDLQYDNDDLTNVYLAHSDHLKSITVPITVRRCDHFKIRMSGFGQFKLYSMGYQLSEGSERCLI